MKEINIKGDIIGNDMAWMYDWFGIDYTCPKNIIDALTSADGDEIVFKINSKGGSIEAASEIYAEIRSYKGKKTARIMGMAASAASVIATACYCEMAPTALFMMHNVSIRGVSGDHLDMEHQAEVLETADKTVAAAYVAKTGKSEGEILSLMEKETWLDANKALELGLIDKIMFDETCINLPLSNMANLLENNLINSSNAISVPDDMIEVLIENQQKQKEYLLNVKKQKLESELRLLKLGGNF